MASVDGRALVAGGGLAVAVCLPLALVATALVDEDDPSGWSALLYLGVLAGFVAAGWVAGRRSIEGPLVTALLAALAGYVVVQGIGVVVSLAGDDDLDVAAVVFNAVVAQGCGLTGAVLAGRWRS